jgi:hypothetical protein
MTLSHLDCTPPGDAQWTAATFQAYWVQRLVSAVQVELALRLLEVRHCAGRRGHSRVSSVL